MIESEIIALMARHLLGEGWKPDDVSTILLDVRRYLVCSVDTLVKSTDIPLGMHLRDAAKKAAVSVVADFASKGARVEAMLISLALPPDHTRGDVEEIVMGLVEAAGRYSFRVLGGDTNEASDLVITCCGLGFTETSPPTRGGARPGDVVATTGLFGLHALGLRLLLLGAVPKTRLEKLAVEKFTKPEARVREGVLAVKSGLITASIDSSDGLGPSLHEIAGNSGVCVMVDSLPVYPGVEETAMRYGISVEEVVLGGGEEYELVFTMGEEGWDALRSLFSEEGLEIHRIGRVEKGEGIYLLHGDKWERIERMGWEHFRGGTLGGRWT